MHYLANPSLDSSIYAIFVSALIVSHLPFPFSRPHMSRTLTDVRGIWRKLAESIFSQPHPGFRHLGNFPSPTYHLPPPVHTWRGRPRKLTGSIFIQPRPGFFHLGHFSSVFLIVSHLPFPFFRPHMSRTPTDVRGS